MKLCMEIAFVPHAHRHSELYNAGEKILPYFFQYLCITQIINGLKLYIMHISMFIYPPSLPLAIDINEVETSPEMTSVGKDRQHTRTRDLPVSCDLLETRPLLG